MFNDYCSYCSETSIPQPADVEADQSVTAGWLLQEARKWTDGQSSVVINGRKMVAYSCDTTVKEVLERFSKADFEAFMQNL